MLCFSTDRKNMDRTLLRLSEGNLVRVGNLETTDTIESSEYGTGVADGGEGDDGRYLR